MARCPAHHDGTASLSVKKGEDGRVLLHCFARCSYEAIIAAMRIPAMAPRTPTSPRLSTLSRITATYDYRDEDGSMLYQVVRMSPKGFRQRRPDPISPGTWIWSLGDVRRVLYRLPEVTEAVARGKTIYVVEGEKDADALVALGVCATTNSGGADKWRPEYAATFRGADVVIVPDNDVPGRAHGSHVRRVLRAVGCRVRVLALTGVPEKGDVSDFLAAGGTVEELARLADETAPDLSEGVPEALDASPEAEAAPAAPTYHLLADLLNDPQLMTAPVAVLPWIGYAGRTSLLAGREKQGGKSTTAAAAMALASQLGVKCLVITLDEPVADTVQRLHRFGANPANVVLMWERPQDADLDAVIEATGAQALVIDSLERWAAGRVTESGSAVQWAAVLAPVIDIARKRTIAAVLLHHASKATGEYRDSTAIGAAVDLIITLVEKPGGSRHATVKGRFPVPDFIVTLGADGRAEFTVGHTAAASSANRAPPSGRLQAQVLRLLQSAEPDGLKTNVWAALVKEDGVSKSTFFRARKALCDNGRASFASMVYRVSPTGARWLERGEVE